MMKNAKHKLRTRRETLLHARLDSPFELLVAFLFLCLNSAKTYTLDYFKATFWHSNRVGHTKLERSHQSSVGAAADSLRRSNSTSERESQCHHQGIDRSVHHPRLLIFN